MTTGEREERRVPAWRRLRRVGEAFLWLVVIGLGVVLALELATRLRLVVLPFLLAVALATFLAPLAHRLKARGWPDGVAALSVVLSALVLLVGCAMLLVPAVVDEFSRFDVEVDGAVDEAQRWIADSPLPISSDQVSDGIDRLQEQLRDSVDALVGPIYAGAVLALEVLAGLVLAVVVLFFLLKDGERIWAWAVGLVTPSRRDDVHAIGERGWSALGGFVRGQTIVALFDAVLIGVGLVIIGVPLALPLAVLTFFGAYVPIVGATVTGVLAILMALVSLGVPAAAATLGVVLIVQQVESNALQPVVVGRAIDVHPLAILLGVTAGGVLAGIIGAMVAAPLVAVAGAVLGYLREQADGPPAQSGDPAAQSGDRPTPASSAGSAPAPPA